MPKKRVIAVETFESIVAVKSNVSLPPRVSRSPQLYHYSLPPGPITSIIIAVQNSSLCSFCGSELLADADDVTARSGETESGVSWAGAEGDDPGPQGGDWENEHRLCLSLRGFKHKSLVLGGSSTAGLHSLFAQ